ncbi:hypothetical protein BCR44DRAFT_44013 [Catenaria anguillulae PL171]|uniref:Uncharacterized protein n=1 Tax=Catenaria anguillulae PL171 TaxID=765915 RepID=A0A1Y2I4H4_9FUNG|nr:hypothetical protein BCR44DRAFT_44013 [Catenaria anguillulae PL171]
MPPILVLATYSLVTRIHTWIKLRGGLSALVRHGGTGDPLVLPRELATLFCALVSFEFLDPLLPAFDKTNLHLLPGAWAGIYLSSGALLAKIALDLSSHHHRVALSAPGTPAQVRSPKLVKHVHVQSPSLMSQARQLPHASSDGFANPPPVSPTLQRRVILERFSPDKPHQQPTRYHGPAAAKRQDAWFEQLASNECSSPAARLPPSSAKIMAGLTRSLSPQLATRFREPSPVRLVSPGLFATQRREENQKEFELKVSSGEAPGSLKEAIKNLGVGRMFGSGDVNSEKRGRSPVRS